MNAEQPNYWNTVQEVAKELAEELWLEWDMPSGIINVDADVVQEDVQRHWSKFAEATVLDGFEADDLLLGEVSEDVAGMVEVDMRDMQEDPHG